MSNKDVWKYCQYFLTYLTFFSTLAVLTDIFFANPLRTWWEKTRAEALPPRPWCPGQARGARPLMATTLGSMYYFMLFTLLTGLPLLRNWRATRCNLSAALTAQNIIASSALMAGRHHDYDAIMAVMVGGYHYPATAPPGHADPGLNYAAAPRSLNPSYSESGPVTIFSFLFARS